MPWHDDALHFAAAAADAEHSAWVDLQAQAELAGRAETNAAAAAAADVTAADGSAAAAVAQAAEDL